MLRKEKGVKQEASCGKMRKEETELTESYFKVGDEVKCKASGMEGKVVKVDEPQTGKYYTVKREDGKEMKYAPDELKLDEEALDEATPSRQQVKQAFGIARDKRYAGGNMTGAMKAMSKINKGLGQHPAVAKELKKQNEDVEQLDEYTPDKSGVTRIQGRAYGASKPEKHAVDTMSGPTRKELTAIEKEKKVKKPFKEMLELYADKGLKALSEMTMTEEPDQEQFEKELAVAKKKATEKKSPEDEAKVAKSLVHSVQQEDVEQLDELSPKTLGSYVKKAGKDRRDIASDYHSSEYVQARREDGVSAKEIGDPDAEKMMKNDERRMKTRKAGIQTATNKLVKKATNEEVEQINERPMTDDEMKKREDIVMGMKKNLQGFKDRYGARAKDVMYATATKQAMKDED